MCKFLDITVTNPSTFDVHPVIIFMIVFMAGWRRCVVVIGVHFVQFVPGGRVIRRSEVSTQNR